MDAHKVDYQIFHNWIIPAKYLDDYAGIIAYSKQYNATIPGPTKDYFIRRLGQFHHEEPTAGFCTINIAPIHDGKLLGWGHLSWSGSEQAWTWGELFVYLRPEFRRRGVGSKMCRTLLGKVSLDALSDCELEIPAFKQGGKEFVDHILQANLVNSQDRKICQIRQFSLSQVERNLAQLSGKAIEQGIEIRFAAGENLDEAVDLTELVALSHSDSGSLDDLSASTEQYLAGMERWQSHGAHYWFYLAFENRTGKLIGFTRSGIKLEGAEGLAHDDQTVLSPGFQDAPLAQTLKLLMLRGLLSETAVTHWINSAPSEAEYLVEVDDTLGFEYFTTHYTYQLNKPRAAMFLQQNKEIQSARPG